MKAFKNQISPCYVYIFCALFAGMEFIKILPTPELASYIHFFWFYEGETGVILKDRTFPDGSIEIVFNLGTTVQRSTNAGGYSVNPEVEVMGQIIHPYSVKCQGLNKFLGVRFFPHTFSCFSKIPHDAFVDQAVEARELLGNEFRNVAREIQDAERPIDKLPLLEQFFLKKLSSLHINEKKYSILAFSVKHINQNVNARPLDEIMSRTGVNARYLQRLFLQNVGISPKCFIKIDRFQRSLQLLRDPSSNLTEIALECGYFDQAHFNHDFKSFTGMTPSAYLNDDFPINKYFLSEERNLLTENKEC